MFTRKLIASTVAAATIAGGGLAVAALNPLASAGAQEEQQQTQPDPARHAGRQRVLGGVLDELVADGTLTQAQADAVTDGMKDAMEDRRHDRRQHRQELLALVADTIGVEKEDLVTELKAGRSIAEVAADHDVARATVVDAIVAHGNQRVDQAVADGTLTEERAAKIEERIPKLAERIVDHTRQPR